MAQSQNRCASMRLRRFLRSPCSLIAAMEVTLLVSSWCEFMSLRRFLKTAHEWATSSGFFSPSPTPQMLGAIWKRKVNSLLVSTPMQLLTVKLLTSLALRVIQAR